jgi:hypothetical protein
MFSVSVFLILCDQTLLQLKVDHSQLKKKKWCGVGYLHPVAHAYKPSYSGGLRFESSPGQIVLETLS